MRVSGVDAVDAVLAYQDLFAVRLQGTLDGHRVGGEVRHAGAGAENHYPPLFQVPNGTKGDVRLGDLAHGDSGLHPRVDTRFLLEVFLRQAVNHRVQHANVVGADPVEATLGCI